jgi:hypothetical protein
MFLEAALTQNRQNLKSLEADRNASVLADIDVERLVRTITESVLKELRPK